MTTDVFISYSRKDKEFVRRLNDALEQAGYTTWIDWEDIPLSSDWMDEIRRGIEGASNFLFIISPDSVESDPCYDEWSHAITHNKRLLPLLHREIALPKGNNPRTRKRRSSGRISVLDEAFSALGYASHRDELIAQLSPHNWIFFRDDDDFDQALQSLLETMRTDLDYVKEHTRLLVRAREWENRGRAHGFLLTGDEVVEANKWLMQATTTHPEATELHVEYIRESGKLAEQQQAQQLDLERKSATRLRLLVVALSIFLLVAIVLVGVAFNAQQNAKHQQELAEKAEFVAVEQRSLAQALALAANSINALQDSRPNFALTLALQSYDAYQPPLVQTQRMLAASAYHAGIRLQLDNLDASVLSVDYQPNGSLIAVGDVGGHVYLWDTQTGEILHQFEGHTGSVNQVRFSPDGQWIASASNDHTVRVWDAASYEQVQVLEDHTDAVFSVAFNNEGNLLASGGGTPNAETDTAIRLWDLATGEVIRTLAGHTGTVFSLHFNRAGDRLLSGSGGSNDNRDRTARIWDVETGEQLESFGGDSGWIRSAVFSPDEKYILYGSWDTVLDGTLSMWEVDNPEADEPYRRFYGLHNVVTDVAFMPDGRHVIGASWDTTVRMWNVGTGLQVQGFAEHDDRVLTLALSPDSQYLVVGVGATNDDNTEDQGEENAGLAVWDIEDRAKIDQLEGHQDWVWTAEYNSDGTRAVSASGNFSRSTGDNTLRIWDIETSTEIQELRGQTTRTTAAVWSPDDSKIYASGLSGKIYVWDTTSWAKIQTADFDEGIRHIQVSPDGQYIAATLDSNQANVLLLDAETLEIIRTFSGHTRSANYVAFTSDSQFLVSTSLDETARVWNVETGETVHVLRGHEREVLGVDISHDDQYAMTASQDGTVRIWSLATGEQVQMLSGHVGSAVSVTFNLDGTLAVSGGSDGTVRIWDVQTGDELRTFEGGNEWVQYLQLSPQGDTFLASQGDFVIVWRLHNTVEELIAWARANRYVPPMSCQELAVYNLDEVNCTQEG